MDAPSDPLPAPGAPAPGDVPAPWTRLASEALFDCSLFTLHRHRARSATRPEPRSFYTLDAPDWVNVVALTPADGVLLVRQYRHGSRGLTLEIPGGMVDPGESAATAAARELLEETGHVADRFDLLGSVNPNPALFGNVCSTFLAQGARRVAPVRNQGAEETQVVIVPREQLDERVRAGEITHALVLAAFHWLALATPTRD